ncbi:MAG TPA: HlyD family type I secretion periplasmic adaptor subunit [Gammaproteobacteria bacterium]|nr:HlyD family type I secretion periplasmic adaptor subunit [Gammaproteobacteria bacterium]
MSKRRDPELEFLPAAQEIVETPPLPAARCLLWSIVLCAIIAAAWSVIGRVDIVGVAPGRVVATGRTKLVQAHATAVIARLHVREGQRVAAGELLVELDATAARAEAARLAAECASLALDAERLAQLVAATQAVMPAADLRFVAAARASVSPAHARAAQQFDLQLADYRASLASLDDERREKEAARAASLARVAQLVRTLPLIAESAEAHRALTEKGVVARVHWLAVERERIATEQELAARRDEARALAAALAALAERRAASAAQFRARWAAEREDVVRRLASCREARTNNARSLELTRLIAPIAGTVQQLTVHTEGGVVGPVEPLMAIAPAASPLEVEARVAQRDIGFVHIGQRAVVKFDAYDYTRYGTLNGRVARLSDDAVHQPDEESYFLAQIALDSTRLPGRDLIVEPGMRATVELAMGRRRVVQYLLSPLLRYTHEAARER